jgi:hypothetical protein
MSEQDVRDQAALIDDVAGIVTARGSTDQTLKWRPDAFHSPSPTPLTAGSVSPSAGCSGAGRRGRGVRGRVEDA